MQEKKDVSIHTYIPHLYLDRNYTNNNNIINHTNNGFYRFYGIYINTEQIGFAKYHIYYGQKIGELEIIEITQIYQNKGYGTILLKYSLNDLSQNFPFLEKITVCSSYEAINFYTQNEFQPYFGDNNLIKKLI